MLLSIVFDIALHHIIKSIFETIINRSQASVLNQKIHYLLWCNSRFWSIEYNYPLAEQEMTAEFPKNSGQNISWLSLVSRSYIGISFIWWALRIWANLLILAFLYFRTSNIGSIKMSKRIGCLLMKKSSTSLSSWADRKNIVLIKYSVGMESTV